MKGGTTTELGKLENLEPGGRNERKRPAASIQNGFI